MKALLLTLLLLLLPGALAAQSFNFNFKVNPTLETLNFSPKEAYFLYSKALNQKLTVEGHLANLDLSIQKDQAKLDFLELKGKGPGLSDNDRATKKVYENRIINALTQKEPLQELLATAKLQLEFLEQTTAFNYKPEILKKVYEISPSKNPYPMVLLPIIDDAFSFKLSPTINLALPVEL